MGDEDIRSRAVIDAALGALGSGGQAQETLDAESVGTVGAQ